MKVRKKAACPLTAQSRKMQGKRDFSTGSLLCVNDPRKIEV
jgi:hypothetical protein